MKNAIICHGVRESFDKVKTNIAASCSYNWLPWLQQKFIIAGVPTQVPSFTNSWLPDRDYNADKELLNRFDIGAETALIGHSCGGGFFAEIFV